MSGVSSPTARSVVRPVASSVVGSDGAGAWNPLRLSGLVFAFDAELGGGLFTDEAATDAVNAVSDTVRAWTDAVSALTITTQGTAANAVPVTDYSGTLLPRSNGINKGLRADIGSPFSLTDYSIHLVCRGPVTTTLVNAFGFGPGTDVSPLVSPNWTTNGLEISAGSTVSGIEAFLGDTFRVFSWVRSGTAISVYVDGVLAFTGSGGTAATVSGAKLFASAAAGSSGVTIAAAILSTEPNTADEVLQLADYYKAKSWYGQSNYDVVWLGDSISTPIYAGTGKSIVHKLLAASSSVDYPINMSVGGATLSDWITWAPDRVVPRLLGGEVVVIWLGTNDIEAGASGATAFTRLQTLCNLLAPHCAAIVVGTTIPRSSFDATKETHRNTFNSSIIGGDASYDYVADPTANTAFDATADTSNATYYSVDGIHLKEAGVVVAETYFRTQIETALT